MLEGDEIRPPVDAEERQRRLAAARIAIDHAQWLLARVLRLEDVTRPNVAGSAQLTARPNPLEELQTTIANHARLMRQSGEPPEAVIVRVKEVTEAASREIFAEKRLLDWSRVASLRNDVVRWSVAAYYDP
jgi:hypothetical protein